MSDEGRARAGVPRPRRPQGPPGRYGGFAPPEPPGAAGAPPGAEPRGEWLTGEAAEALLAGGRVPECDGEAALAARRLSLLLAAAARPGGLDPLDPLREEAALAAYRAARGRTVAVQEPDLPGRVQRAGIGRPVRMAAAVAASVVALSGVAVAVAATTGQVGRTPQHPAGSTAPAAVASDRSGPPDTGATGAAGATGQPTRGRGASVRPVPGGTAAGSSGSSGSAGHTAHAPSSRSMSSPESFPDLNPPFHQGGKQCAGCHPGRDRHLAGGHGAGRTHHGAHGRGHDD